MEKQRTVTGKKSFRRFLSFIFILPMLQNFLSAQDFSFSLVENQSLYANQDILFELYIPDFQPSELELEHPKETSDVKFKRLTSSRYYEKDGASQNGTKFELTLNFLRKGNYKLSPLKIKNRKKTILVEFPPLLITQNPMETQPSLVIEFSNGHRFYSDYENFMQIPPEELEFPAKNGEKLKFKAGIIYAASIRQFNWSIPENSILVRTKEFNFEEQKQNQKKSAYPDTPIFLGEFEWTILKTGSVFFPDFFAEAQSFSGNEFHLSLKGIQFRVTESDSSSSLEETDYYSEIFGSDFAQDFSDPAQGFSNITKEDCAKLAKLRHKEKWNPFTGSKNKRRALELEFNLTSNQDEFPSWIIPVLIVFSILSILFMIIFIKKNKSSFSLLFGIIAFCSIGALLYSLISSRGTYGISSRCVLNSIPEASAEASSTLSAGNRVLVTEKSGDWCYVRLGNSGGWCKKENIFFID